MSFRLYKDTTKNKGTFKKISALNLNVNNISVNTSSLITISKSLSIGGNLAVNKIVTNSGSLTLDSSLIISGKIVSSSGSVILDGSVASSGNLVYENKAQTLTNKTIDYNSNTITNFPSSSTTNICTLTLVNPSVLNNTVLTRVPYDTIEEDQSSGSMPTTGVNSKITIQKSGLYEVNVRMIITVGTGGDRSLYLFSETQGTLVQVTTTPSVTISELTFTKFLRFSSGEVIYVQGIQNGGTGIFGVTTDISYRNFFQVRFIQ